MTSQPDHDQDTMTHTSLEAHTTNPQQPAFPSSGRRFIPSFGKVGGGAAAKAYSDGQRLAAAEEAKREQRDHP